MCSVEGDILVSNIVRREEGSGEYLIPSLQQLKKKVERVFGVQPSVVLSEAREGVSEDTCGDACGKRQFRAYGEALLKQHGVEVCVKGDIEEEKGDIEEENREMETEEKKEEMETEETEMETEKETEEKDRTSTHLLPSPYTPLSLPPPPAAPRRLPSPRLHTAALCPSVLLARPPARPCLHPLQPLSLPQKPATPPPTSSHALTASSLAGGVLRVLHTHALTA